MLLEKIKTPGLSHLSYLIGSGGKAIHQIEIERGNTIVTQKADASLDQAFRLNPSDSFLTMRGEGLHAQACTFDPDVSDGLRPFRGEGSGVEFDGENRMVDAKPRYQSVDEGQELGWTDGIRASASERDPSHASVGR